MRFANKTNQVNNGPLARTIGESGFFSMIRPRFTDSLDIFHDRYSHVSDTTKTRGFKIKMFGLPL